ncbi:MAG: hypothetical protein AAGA92_06870 [Planctomycetota bacterium]
MKLPSLKVAIPAIFLFWCVAGVVAKGWVMLVYPGMWAAVAGAFYGLHLMLRAQPAPSGFAEEQDEAAEEHAVAAETPAAVDREPSAAL